MPPNINQQMRQILPPFLPLSVSKNLTTDSPGKLDSRLGCIPPDDGGIRDGYATSVYWGVQGAGCVGGIAGRQDGSRDRLEAQGASEPGEHVEAPSDRRSGRGVLERP